MRRFCIFLCAAFLCTYSFAQESLSPIVKEHFPVKELSWDSTDRLFAYMEEDVIFLRDLAEYRLIGTIDFPGVLGFSLYHEAESGVQVIAGSEDGTFAVWSIPTSSTVSFAGGSDMRGGGISQLYNKCQ